MGLKWIDVLPDLGVLLAFTNKLPSTVNEPESKYKSLTELISNVAPRSMTISPLTRYGPFEDGHTSDLVITLESIIVSAFIING